MKHNLKYFLIAVVTLLRVISSAEAKIKIVTTASDFADLAQQIGQDKVEVHLVMKGPENVHNVIAKPTEMLQLNQADLFVHGGLDSEPWRDNLLKGSRNSKVMTGKPGNVDMSVGIKLKDVPEGKIDRSQGDMHGFGNPHFQLNPEVAQRMTVTLLKAMQAADPANAEFYKANAVKLVEDLAKVHRQIREQFAPYTGLKVVTFHDAWQYFADAIPIHIAGTIEPKPGITPSPAQVHDLVTRMKEQQVKVVICETYDDDKLAQEVANDIGGVMIRLPDHVNGVPEATSYQELFRYDTRKILEAAKQAGVEAAKP